MYAVTAKEALQDGTLITRTLLIHSALATILFDSSSTHTFIANTFVDRFGMSVEDLSYDLVVSTHAVKPRKK